MQASDKRPSAAYSGPLTVSRACQELLLIRRDATLRISGALHLDIFDQPGRNEFFSGLHIYNPSLNCGGDPAAGEECFRKSYQGDDAERCLTLSVSTGE